MLKSDITAELVARLVAEQFPQWAHLAVTAVEHDGWDNNTFRLGDAMSVRLPSADMYVAQIEKEHEWLPVLAPNLPLPIPVPLERGAPTKDFPRPWSVYGWIHGEIATADNVEDLTACATDLAAFLRALYACPPDGPLPGDHSFARGGPVTAWSDLTREALAALDDVIDVHAAQQVWQQAVAQPHEGPDVWVHGDITGANLIVANGRLAGVIDFGCSAVGDPACDLTIAWTFFHGESRRLFRSLVPVDASTWARARGWSLWKALMHLMHDLRRPGAGRHFDRQVGWRISAREIVGELIDDVS